MQNIGQDFKRIRIGIGRDERFANLADFVLSKIPSSRLEEMYETIDEAVALVDKKLGE